MKKIIDNSFYKKEKIFVYQMGKVASTSIVESLNREGITAYHMHSIFSDMNRKQIKRIKTKDSIWKVLYDNFLGSYKKFLLNIPNKKCKIVTLVRDPISRDISMLFQLSHLLIYEFFASHNNSRAEEDSTFIWQTIHQKYYNYKYALEWFDNEFKRTTGIDVYEFPFDQENGYTIIDQGNYSILILQFERLDSLEDKIAEFVGIEEFKIIKSNRASEKWYSGIYSKYKSDFRLSDKMLEKVYSSKYVNHFYQEAQIENFKLKHES